MALGRRHFKRGEIDEGFECWQKAFNKDIEIRALLVEQLHRVFPAEFLVARLRPDTPGLWRLYNNYVGSGDEAGVQWMNAYMIEHVQKSLQHAQHDEERADRYFELHTLYRESENPGLALRSVQKAVAIRPSEYTFRHALATVLMDLKRYEESLEAIRWCQTRRPDDLSLDRMEERCVRLQIAQGRRAKNIELKGVETASPC